MSGFSLRFLGHSTVRLDLGGRAVPRGAGTWLHKKGFERVEEIAPGETRTDGGLTVTATEAVHSGHRWRLRLTHGPQSPAIGHVTLPAPRDRA